MKTNTRAASGRRWRRRAAQLFAGRLDAAQEVVEQLRAIAETALVRDLARQLACEGEAGRRRLEPVQRGLRRGRCVKGRVHFHGAKVLRVKCEPIGGREVL